MGYEACLKLNYNYSWNKESAIQILSTCLMINGL